MKREIGFIRSSVKPNSTRSAWGSKMKYLLIMPSFYGYYKRICEVLNKAGNEVFFFPDEIAVSFGDRILKKCQIDSIQKSYDNYIKMIPQKLHGIHVDKVVIIFAGRYMTPENVQELRKQYPEAEFVYYTWDSVKNFPNIKNIYKLFDRSYSFDKIDCKQYGMEFLPLFYSNDYIEEQTIYDVTSLMTYGIPKAESYHRIMNSLPDGLEINQYLVMKHRSTYLYNKMKSPKSFAGIEPDTIKFKPLNQVESNRMFAQSKVVIDCPLDGQNGLTMRTFEVLHLSKKLITTNANIKGYDFYTPDNIFVVDGMTRIPNSFFEEPYNTMSSLSDNYSIDTFVSVLFGI